MMLAMMAQAHAGNREYYNTKNQRHETREDVEARLEREHLQKQAKADFEKKQRHESLKLKGETMAVLMQEFMQASHQHSFSGKTRQAFIQNIVKFINDFVEELDSYHPFHKDLRNFKNDLMVKLDDRPLRLFERFIEHALPAELAERYKKGERTETPTTLQLEDIAANEKYWNYYIMYVAQELESAQGKCNNTRTKCIENLSSRASALARSMESKKQDALHPNVLARKIMEAFETAFTVEQRLAYTDKKSIYGQVIGALEAYLTQGSKEFYTQALRTAWHDQKEVLIEYKNLKSTDDKEEETEIVRFVHKVYINPWPKVKTEAEKREEEKKKKEADEKAKNTVTQKKKEKENTPEKKVLKDVQDQGAKSLQRIFGQIFGGDKGGGLFG